MADENITGKRIKDLCRQKGITVRELAEKSNTTEVSMIRIITEARMPNAPTWRRSGMKVMLDDGAYMPERAHDLDAGYDLRTPVNVQIAARRGATIDTKVHVMIPKGYAGFIKSKSGLLSRNNIRVDGVVDAGYTGTIKVMMFNDGLMDKEFRVGDKIAQLVVVKISTTKPEQVDSFPDTERGENGFGSTGR